MVSYRLVKSNRLFLYLSLGLIVLALVCLPAKVRVVVEPEVGETELMFVGPIIALIIASWSLPTLLLGVIEYFPSRRAVLTSFLPILYFSNAIPALIACDIILHGMLVQRVFTYSPILFPSAITDMIGFLFLAKGEKLASALKSSRVKFLLATVLVAFPVVTAAGILYSWLIQT